MKLEFPTTIFEKKKPKDLISSIFVQWKPSFFPADRLDTTKLIVAFRNYANAPKESKVRLSEHLRKMGAGEHQNKPSDFQPRGRGDSGSPRTRRQLTPARRLIPSFTVPLHATFGGWMRKEGRRKRVSERDVTEIKQRFITSPSATDVTPLAGCCYKVSLDSSVWIHFSLAAPQSLCSVAMCYTECNARLIMKSEVGTWATVLEYGCNKLQKICWRKVYFFMEGDWNILICVEGGGCCFFSLKNTALRQTT